MLAPTSILPARISKMVPRWSRAPLYDRAVSRSVVIDSNPNSTPPLKSSGLSRTDTTFAFTCALHSFSTAFSSCVILSIVISALDIESEKWIVNSLPVTTASVTSRGFVVHSSSLSSSSHIFSRPATPPPALSRDATAASADRSPTAREPSVTEWRAERDWLWRVFHWIISHAWSASASDAALIFTCTWHSRIRRQNCSGKTMPPSPR
mmetsp:Transcript_4396/g.12966  ORF Transcript_4396/g.12966 Transcript_4396/m.12966 type:complete len:208 (+) Transcript_4396:1500-2123(+)